MNDTSSRNYPLGALFVLVAFCGILAALAAPLARAISREQVGIVPVALAMLAGAVAAGILGTIVGALHRRWMLGGLLGLGVGVLVGATAGPLALIPADSFPGLMIASIGGSIVMIAIGSALRWGSK